MDTFHPDDQVVSLSTAPNPVLAHIWENALREEGIHCQVVGDFLDAGIGDISGVQPEIWINRQDMTQAQAILGRCPQSAIDSDDENTWSGSGPFDQPKAIGFDLDPASLNSLQEAFPEWEIEVLTGASETSLTDLWNPGEVNLLVVKAHDEARRTLALCRFLVRCPVFSRDCQTEVADTLGPRGSLQTQAQRAHAPLLVLVSVGQEDLVKSALEAGAHSCLMLPIDAKEVASMLVHARAGNQPGRHTDNLEQAQSKDRWRDDGGQG